MDIEPGAEIEKIENHWFKAPLRYEFGAIVNLRADRKHEIRVLKNTTSERAARYSSFDLTFTGARIIGHEREDSPLWCRVKAVTIYNFIYSGVDETPGVRDNS
jgi:uncharacterized protein involved in tellurium resistance